MHIELFNNLYIFSFLALAGYLLFYNIGQTFLTPAINTNLKAHHKNASETRAEISTELFS